MRNKIQIILHIIIVIFGTIGFLTPCIVPAHKMNSQGYAFIIILLFAYLLFTPISIFKIKEQWK